MDIVKEPKKTGRGGWRPGGGRPKGRKSDKTLEIEAEARKYCGDALKALVSIAAKGESESARVSAATALIDRGYGKAKQSLDVQATVTQLTEAERLARLAAIMGGLE